MFDSTCNPRIEESEGFLSRVPRPVPIGRAGACKTWELDGSLAKASVADRHFNEAPQIGDPSVIGGMFSEAVADGDASDSGTYL
jgi:hypothetical protein